MTERRWPEKASQAWDGWVGSQTPADFMRESRAMGYLTVQAATEAYEANIPFMFPDDDELDTTGVAGLLAEYIRYRLPEIEPAGRINPAAVETLKQAITNLVNMRQHSQAERLARLAAPDMDPETHEAFATWCAGMGIR